MTNDELWRLKDLLDKALDDETVAGIRPAGTRGKRAGTDFARSLDAVNTALIARGER